MNQQSLSSANPLALSATRAEVLKAAFVALFLGVGLVYLVGFSHSDTAHDAAHDTRHSLSFPCH
ncbi:MAG TPA: CbtB-domain containing protein [Methylocystis sp.]